MKVTITSIELKGPMKFFLLSAQALKITQQLKASTYKAFKKQGFWTTHYTMTLWDSEEDLRAFAMSGSHLEAMKIAAKMANEIRTITIDAEKFPSWKEAKELLINGKSFKY